MKLTKLLSAGHLAVRLLTACSSRSACATHRPCEGRQTLRLLARKNENERSAAILPRDWILLALGESANGSLQPLQLQKALRLLSQSLPSELLQCGTFYDFTPNEYGPYSGAIY